jgi:hypothetical protein
VKAGQILASFLMLNDICRQGNLIAQYQPNTLESIIKFTCSTLCHIVVIACEGWTNLDSLSKVCVSLIEFPLYLWGFIMRLALGWLQALWLMRQGHWLLNTECTLGIIRGVILWWRTWWTFLVKKHYVANSGQSHQESDQLMDQCGDPWWRRSTQDQMIPGLSPGCTWQCLITLSPHVHQRSLTGFIKCRMVCGLPVIHAPKRPLGIIWK